MPETVARAASEASREGTRRTAPGSGKASGRARRQRPRQAKRRWELEDLPSLELYPTVSEGAKMLRVSTSTLSRRKDLQRTRRGNRDQVLFPSEVLRLAAVYRRRSLNEVAADLIAFAQKQGGKPARERADSEVEAFFTGHSRHEPNEEWFETARSALPPELFERVVNTIRDRTGQPPADIVGFVPRLKD